MTAGGSSPAGRLAGKTAWVTGTGRGIGRAIAQVCAAEGARVVGCDLDDASSGETVELVRSAGGRMVARGGVDLVADGGARDWSDWAGTQFGPCDILVNSAGAIRFGPLEELSFEDWRFTITCELDIVFLVTKAVWPSMLERGAGSIVNVASISATRGAGFMPQNAHGAAKGGVLALTMQLAVEGGPRGIRVNAVSPAMTATPHTAPLLSDPESPFAGQAERIPLRRVGRPEDVAHAVAFLASDDAAHITGVNLPVDGGASAIG